MEKSLFGILSPPLVEQTPGPQRLPELSDAELTNIGGGIGDTVLK